MAQSTRLAQEVEAMRRIEAAMAHLPDDQMRSRVARWFDDNYAAPPTTVRDMRGVSVGSSGFSANVGGAGIGGGGHGG
jgi:uncharacterized membrane protein